MPTNSTPKAKAFIEFLNQKLNEFLDYALGPKIKTNPAPKSSLDPLIFFSKRQIMKKIYKRMK
jgi:hypothetical protein